VSGSSPAPAMRIRRAGGQIPLPDADARGTGRPADSQEYLSDQTDMDAMAEGCAGQVQTLDLVALKERRRRGADGMVHVKAVQRILVNEGLCKACGICSELCPRDVHDATEEGVPVVARLEDCTGCMFCEWHCPDFAIRVQFADEHGASPEPMEQIGERSRASREPACAPRPAAEVEDAP
jgi:2-oxoglutarate ferredoxin oxidoreductase subunit delta